jgi:hypothetical protein
VADEQTFSNLVDYLSDHEGKNVYVEIGTHDHEGPENADLFILKLHGYRLGKVQDVKDYSSQERRGVMVWLEPRDSEPLGEDEEREDSTRFFITPQRVTKIQGDPARGVKVWLDDAVYLSIS